MMESSTLFESGPLPIQILDCSVVSCYLLGPGETRLAST